jgi:hypothetical protein
MTLAFALSFVAAKTVLKGFEPLLIALSRLALIGFVSLTVYYNVVLLGEHHAGQPGHRLAAREDADHVRPAADLAPGGAALARRRAPALRAALFGLPHAG